MDADYDIFEIVAVIRDFWLVDAESYQRRYCTNHGQPLVPGYYVVNWPESIRARRFNEHAVFHGPFKLRQEAQKAHDWIHKKRESILTGVSELSSVTTSNSSRMGLPTATKAKVINLENDKRVEDRINGRRPYTKDRVIELSRAAAKKPGTKNDGTNHVKIDTKVINKKCSDYSA